MRRQRDFFLYGFFTSRPRTMRANPTRRNTMDAWLIALMLVLAASSWGLVVLFARLLGR
jgi:hypothetical protein